MQKRDNICGGPASVLTLFVKPVVSQTVSLECTAEPVYSEEDRKLVNMETNSVEIINRIRQLGRVHDECHTDDTDVGVRAVMMSEMWTLAALEWRIYVYKYIKYQPC